MVYLPNTLPFVCIMLSDNYISCHYIQCMCVITIPRDFVLYICYVCYVYIAGHRIRLVPVGDFISD